MSEKKKERKKEMPWKEEYGPESIHSKYFLTRIRHASKNSAIIHGIVYYDMHLYFFRG